MSFPTPNLLCIDFATLAAAAAAHIIEVIPAVRVAGRVYRRWAGATYPCFTSADGSKWVPAEAITVQHWAANTVPGTTDLFDAVYSALRHALQLGGRQRVSLGGEVVGISETVYPGPSTGGMVLCDGTLKALGSARWTVLSGFTAPLIFANETDEFWLENIQLECNWLSSGVNFRNGADCGCCPGVVVRHWNRADDGSYGIRLEQATPNWIGFGPRAEQWEYGEAGYDVQANRTGYGFKLETADFILFGPVASYCKYPIHKSGFGSWEIANPHVYNGSLTTITDPDAIYGVWIDAAGNGRLIGGYYDNCTLVVVCDNLTTSATQTLTIAGGWFPWTGVASNTDQLRLITTVASNDLAGLTIADCRFQPRADNLRRVATGGGSFATWPKLTFDNVLDQDGALPSGHGTPARQGITAARPGSAPLGYQFFDETLGLPVFSTGAGTWKNAAGSVV